jgi:hypothetical protein
MFARPPPLQEGASIVIRPRLPRNRLCTKITSDYKIGGFVQNLTTTSSVVSGLARFWAQECPKTLTFNQPLKVMAVDLARPAMACKLAKYRRSMRRGAGRARS